MRIIIALLISLVFAIAADAQTGNIPENVNISRPVVLLPETARYQIIPILRQFGLVVKLDRYSGRTYEFERSRNRWNLINVRGGFTTGSGSTPKYQIIDMDNMIFLLNNESGQTWILVNRIWEPLVD